MAAAKAKPKAAIDLGSTAYVISVHGPFDSRTLVDLPTTVAEQLFEDALRDHAPRRVVGAAEGEVEKIREVDATLAESSLAATAIALAFQIESPGNSATSKSMCARELRDTMDRLRELMPESREADGVDDLTARREARIASVG